jgi:hypothetical protein
VGEVNRLGVDTECAAGGGFWRRPAVPAIITYPGWWRTGCSCFPRRWRGQGSTPAVAEAGGSAPERPGEHSATVEAAYRSGVAPELASSKCASPEQGSSGRPTKKSRLRSKM